MKKLFALLLVLGMLVGCSTKEEELKVGEQDTLYQQVDKINDITINYKVVKYDADEYRWKSQFKTTPEIKLEQVINQEKTNDNQYVVTIKNKDKHINKTYTFYYNEKKGITQSK